jgi:hypothetical protein
MTLLFVPLKFVHYCLQQYRESSSMSSSNSKQESVMIDIEYVDKIKWNDELGTRLQGLRNEISRRELANRTEELGHRVAHQYIQQLEQPSLFTHRLKSSHLTVSLMQTLTPELQKLLTQLSQHLQSEPEKNPPLLEIWDLWVADLDLSRQTLSDITQTSAAKLSKLRPLASKLLAPLEIAPPKLSIKNLAICERAATGQNLKVCSTANPWLKVKPRKGTKEIIKPFSQDEAARIIAGFEESYPAWVPFTKFLFLSGCRMSEAIGLQWKHVDFERGEICICESLAQRKDGNGYERVRKSTKTGSVRFLKINSELSKSF